MSITAVLNLKSDFERMHLRGHSIEMTLCNISVRCQHLSKNDVGGEGIASVLFFLSKKRPRPTDTVIELHSVL